MTYSIGNHEIGEDGKCIVCNGGREFLEELHLRSELRRETAAANAKAL